MEKPEKLPRMMGLQWLLIGIVMIVCPIWVIATYLLDIHEFIILTYVAVVVVLIGAWVISVGVDLIIKYDLKE